MEKYDKNNMKNMINITLYMVVYNGLFDAAQ